MVVAYDVMVREFTRVLEKYGITGEDAAISAKLFADASRDGVHTHGLNRFPKFIASIKNGSVDVSKRAHLSESFGVLERWDGEGGPGNLNAYKAMDRAIELAKKQTVGIVGLRNTNHWMRPGNYGIQAAEQDCIGILWTNTLPNMPAWGGKDAKVGNNPLVIAIPNGDTPVLLDIAMSMFSYGKLEKYAREGKECPVDGGFDVDGNITRNPSDILATHQVLPIGYWKGSGLSLVLDLVAATISGGNTTHEVGALPTETELSQFFMAINLAAFPDRERIAAQIHASLLDLKASEPMQEDDAVRFPGEGMAQTRLKSMEQGVWVDEGIWQGVLEL